MEYSNFTVMIVDDEAPYRKFIKLVIEKNLKCQVIEAKNPREAFEYLDNNKVALILLDMQMPYMDGLTALKIIRDTITTANTPVIACTALSNAELLAKLYKLNISDYILKPAMEKTVVNKIKKVLDGLSPINNEISKSENIDLEEETQISSKTIDIENNQ